MSLEIQAAPSDEIVLEELRRWYDSLWSRAQAINTKAGMLLPFQGATVLVLLGNPAQLISKLRTAAWGIQALAALDGVAFLGGVVFAMLTLETYMFPYPNPKDVQNALVGDVFKTGVGSPNRLKALFERAFVRRSAEQQGDESFNYLRDRGKVGRQDFLNRFPDGYAKVVWVSVDSAVGKNQQYIRSLWLTIGFSVLLLVIAILVYWG